jgi:hypothetical protein
MWACRARAAADEKTSRALICGVGSNDFAQGSKLIVGENYSSSRLARITGSGGR